MEHINGSSNIFLLRALNKYGLDAFEFIVVEFVKDTSLLTTREQVHLDWNPCLVYQKIYAILFVQQRVLG